MDNIARNELYPLEQLSFETAAEHVCTRVPIVAPPQHVTEIRQLLMGQRYESATHIAVCDQGRLAGILTIEELLAAPGEVSAEELMDPDPPAVAPHADQEVAAWRAVRHQESALAVVDDQGHFLGFIPPHRLLAVLLWEHEEDMSRLGGFIRDTSAARSASLEAVNRRFLHRAPWLLVGLVGALLAADVVGFFVERLQSQVMLAFFIPGIVYLADAVGTQTEALVVRGLSVGVRISDILVQEVLTGLLVGLALSLAFFPIILWRWGAPEVALIVSLSLLIACTIATTIALALPWVFHRLGRDPAFGSGPLATVIQDVLTLLIYFSIASAVLR